MEAKEEILSKVEQALIERGYTINSLEPKFTVYLDILTDYPNNKFRLKYRIKNTEEYIIVSSYDDPMLIKILKEGREPAQNVKDKVS